MNRIHGRRAATAPDPGPIVRLSTAYWDSQVMLTAARLKLFDLLGSGSRTADAVAEAAGLDPRATRLFLNALVGLGLLEQERGRYHNAPVAQAFLVSASPAYMGRTIGYSGALFETWGRLEQALRTGQPVLAPQAYLGGGEDRTRAFVESMHERALGVARALVDLVDLTGRRRLLDVGGGAGTYSVMLTERHPGLVAEVLELAGVAAVARELVAGAGAANRVSVRDGDYHESDFGRGYDVVLMSGMFHRESEAGCRQLIAKAHDCLQPGGLLVVSDVFADAGGTTPPFAALFGVNMMLTAPEGGVHADADVLAWLVATGFSDAVARAFPPPMPHRMVTGVRP
jgi:SAM-dependent methyltransferase